MSKRKVKNIIEVKPMFLLPPAKDKCQECAVKHEPHEPHDATSLFYKVKFKMDNDREATWKDAMSHCTEDIKKLWIHELEKLGVDINSHITGLRK